jgi:hypothetical protein
MATLNHHQLTLLSAILSLRINKDDEPSFVTSLHQHIAELSSLNQNQLTLLLEIVNMKLQNSEMALMSFLNKHQLELLAATVNVKLDDASKIFQLAQPLLIEGTTTAIETIDLTADVTEDDTEKNTLLWNAIERLEGRIENIECNCNAF